MSNQYDIDTAVDLVVKVLTGQGDTTPAPRPAATIAALAELAAGLAVEASGSVPEAIADLRAIGIRCTIDEVMR